MNDEAPAVEAPPTEEVMPVKQRMTETLPCRLTVGEQIEHSRHLARMLDDLDAMDDDHSAQKLAMKEERANLEAAIRSTRRLVASSKEERLVEVEDRNDYATNKVFRVRMDTSEIVRERAMTMEERQVGLSL